MDLEDSDGMAGSGERATIELIVADGGASRCRLAAFDADGCRLGGAVIDAPASLTLGEERAWSTLRAGIRTLAATLGESDPAWLPGRLAFGLAGALRDERRERFLALVGRDAGVGTRCRVVTDGHAQLVGASGGRAGVCLAVGTGSVVHWRDDDGVHGMAGGWGYPVGDEGSGAWLGTRLLQCYVWHRDGETRDSSLMRVLDERTGGAVSSIQRLTTEARSSAQAALAPLVVEAAGGGDTLAMSLLDEGADWCARLIECAPGELPVHLVGGLSGVYASRLADRFGDRLREPHGDALDGLRTIAREHEA